MRFSALLVVLTLPLVAGASCGDGASRQPGPDAGSLDGAATDGGADARPGEADAGLRTDARVNAPDAADDGEASTPASDSGRDADASRDASRDADVADAATDASAADAAEAGPGFHVPPGYPAGPYGGAVGDTLPPLIWEGYVSPDGASLARDQAYGSYTPDDLRRSGKTLALIHFADFDCPGCRSGASDLAARGAELSSAGGGTALVMEVLISKLYSSPADRTHLDAWVAAFDLTVTTVIDAPGHELRSLGVIGARETAVLVDLATMKVVFRRTGDFFGVQDSSVDFAATELLSRLPP